MKLKFWIIMVFIVLALFLSCEAATTFTELQREQLFTLHYGILDDQLNLFALDGNTPPLKTRITMKDGIFYVSNGNAGKIIILSSFGDLLSIIFNPDTNPEPVLLKNMQSQGRFAKPYSLSSPGEIAVNSKRIIFVEDRVPENRRIWDDEKKANLEFVVLRFSSEGEFVDYLGQEGITCRTRWKKKNQSLQLTRL